MSVGGVVVVACALGMVSCSSPSPSSSLIVLQNPRSGEIVACGPTPDTPSADPVRDARRCAVDYEHRGFRQVPLDYLSGSGE